MEDDMSINQRKETFYTAAKCLPIVVIILAVLCFFLVQAIDKMSSPTPEQQAQRQLLLDGQQ